MLRVLHSVRWKPDSDPSLRLSTLSGRRVGKAFLILLLFQRSPLRRSRIVESTPGLITNPCGPVCLRRLAATPSVRSDLVVSRHFAGLLLVDPVRTVAAAHDPGVHRRFTRMLPDSMSCDTEPGATRSLCSERASWIPAMRFLPFEAFPPTSAVVTVHLHHAVTSLVGCLRPSAPTLCGHLAAPTSRLPFREGVDPRLSARSLVSVGRFSPAARPSPALLHTARRSLVAERTPCCMP